MTLLEGVELFGMHRKTLLIGAMLAVSLGLLVFGAFALNYLKRLAPLPTGFVSHAVCSGVFIAGRDFDEVLAHDTMALQRRITDTEIEGNLVTTSFGVWPIGYVSKTLYRPGLGCARLDGSVISSLEGADSLVVEIPAVQSSALAWPELVAAPDDVDVEALADVVDRAFMDEAANYEERQNTRAIVIFYKGQLIAERYGDGFGPDVPLNSWSMTKSATSALIGILVGRGQIELNGKSGIEGWGDRDDLRADVTIEHLLHMTSGLEFNEGYENAPISDVNFMLMTARDLPEFAAAYPVTAEPGSTWSYQTASPVLLGRVIRNSFERDEDYHHFPQRALFNKLGMTNAHYQMDGGGTYVGGAFLYATARDWARFGRLYLNDGLVNGERILPEGWVRFSTTPTEASMKSNAYAAQFWLNAKSKHHWMPAVPEDAYAARGHYGQAVVIIPSYDLVVVRMGQSYASSSWDLERFLVDVLAALPE